MVRDNSGQLSAGAEALGDVWHVLRGRERPQGQGWGDVEGEGEQSKTSCFFLGGGQG